MALRPPVPTRFARNYVKKMTLAQMTSVVTISRPGSPTFDATTGNMTAHTLSTLWTGPAHIYSESGTLTAIGGDLVSMGQTTISITQDAPVPRVDDLVKVNSTLDDPALMGKVYRIVDVSLGGILSPTRTLTVTETEGSPWTS